jgi:PAS domain S-box-containing protein
MPASAWGGALRGVVAESYRQHRLGLIASGLPLACAIVFTVTLLSEVIELFLRPEQFYVALAPNVVQLIIPVVGYALLRRAPIATIEAGTLVMDLLYTVSMTSRLLLTGTNVPSLALFLSLKMLATAVLFPWQAYVQHISLTLTLLLYSLMFLLSGRTVSSAHLLVGPFVAAILSAAGATRADQVRRELFRHSAELSASEAELRSALQAERALVSISREISELTDLHSLLERTNRRTAEALNCDFSTTLLVDERLGRLAEASAFVADRAGSVAARTYETTTESPVALEVLGGRAIVINDPEQQTWFGRERLERLNIQRLALAPIIAKGRVMGILTAGRTTFGPEFDDRALALLQGLAAQSAIAIENARLFADLSASEARYRDLFERANDLIFVVEESGGFRFANQAALSFLHVSAAALESLSWRELLTPASLGRVERRMRLGWRRPRYGSRPVEVEVQHPDGSRAVLEVQTRLISANGHPRAVQCIGRDVTQRKRHDREALEVVRRLRQANQLQSEFVANVSHELRTPLNVIIGYADLLMDDSSLSAEAKVFLDRINAGGRALHRLVESVLEYARLDRGRVALLPTRLSAEQLVLELRALSNDIRSSPDVTLRLHPAPDVELYTDYDRLYSILSNLLLNAIKFTPRGEVEMDVRVIGTEVQFCLRDTGIGMEPEALAHIFEPFRQGDGSPTRTYGGVGLGLAIVRRNLDLLGGSVQVDSAPGEGTTFVVRVPVSLEASNVPTLFQAERISA